MSLDNHEEVITAMQFRLDTNTLYNIVYYMLDDMATELNMDEVEEIVESIQTAGFMNLHATNSIVKVYDQDYIIKDYAEYQVMRRTHFERRYSGVPDEYGIIELLEEHESSIRQSAPNCLVCKEVSQDRMHICPQCWEDASFIHITARPIK